MIKPLVAGPQYFSLFNKTRIYNSIHGFIEIDKIILTIIFEFIIHLLLEINKNNIKVALNTPQHIEGIQITIPDLK